MQSNKNRKKPSDGVSWEFNGPYLPRFYIPKLFHFLPIIKRFWSKGKHKQLLSKYSLWEKGANVI